MIQISYVLCNYMLTNE